MTITSPNNNTDIKLGFVDMLLQIERERDDANHLVLVFQGWTSQITYEVMWVY